MLFSWEGSWFRSLRSCENTRTHSSLCAPWPLDEPQAGNQSNEVNISPLDLQLGHCVLTARNQLPPNPHPSIPRFPLSALSTYYVLGADMNGKCRGQYHLLQTPAVYPPARVCGVMRVKITNGSRQAENQARLSWWSAFSA